MNLIQGQIMNDEQARETVPALYEMLTATLQNGPLPAGKVIEACGKLLENLDREKVLGVLAEGGMSREKAGRGLAEALKIMSPDALSMRVRTELDVPAADHGPELFRRPLGTLFHIAAGNVDALPAYSVIEGLLAGNINILKLPKGADPLSVVLLKQLTEYVPELAEYIYVFDFTSADTEMLERMAEVSDAVVVWGGTEAVQAVRRMARANTKIIEWGHKLSFAYVTEDVTDGQLDGIAFNVMDTNGLLCSSCQGVYVDTEDVSVAEKTGRRLFEAIRRCAGAEEKDSSIRAAGTVGMYTEEIENTIKKDRLVLRGAGCGVVVRRDSALEPSYGYGNIWVKLLPRRDIVKVLKCYKGFLQTAALECGKEDRQELTDRLFAAGVDRITGGKTMSQVTAGEPHDGRLSLREYSKLVCQERDRL